LFQSLGKQKHAVKNSAASGNAAEYGAGSQIKDLPIRSSYSGSLKESSTLKNVPYRTALIFLFLFYQEKRKEDII